MVETRLGPAPGVGRLRGARVGDRLQSRVGRPRLRPHRRSAGGGRRRHAGGDLRPAARLPIGRPGQHDRDAAPRRPGAARAGLLALQRDARTDRRDAARPRRAGHRPAGHRRAHLHLHLHDGQLPARVRPARRAGHRLRPAESDQRRRRRRRALLRRASSRSSASFRSRCGTG